MQTPPVERGTAQNRVVGEGFRPGKQLGEPDRTDNDNSYGVAQSAQLSCGLAHMLWHCLWLSISQDIKDGLGGLGFTDHLKFLLSWAKPPMLECGSGPLVWRERPNGDLFLLRGWWPISPWVRSLSPLELVGKSQRGGLFEVTAGGQSEAIVGMED